MCCGLTAEEEPEGFGEGWQRQDVIVGLQNNNQVVLGVQDKTLKLIKRNALIAYLDFGICNPQVFLPRC